MKTKIVLGLGFGDEGKGLMTDYLCSQSSVRPFVVRFSGGHQAGHTVCTKEGKRHVFSQLGSGSFRGSPTFWSQHCTFSPIDFVNEHARFIRNGITPKFYVDGNAPVTTQYDIFYNRAIEKFNEHGSCGVGFAATVERHEGQIKIFARDIFFLEILKKKLSQVKNYYEEKVSKFPKPVAMKTLKSIYDQSPLEHGEEMFFGSVDKIIESKLIEIADESILKSASSLIFEGSQGILLDMDHGFFPNVTRSNTTSKNAMEIIRRNSLPEPEIYYVTRAYQTRHGNGFMTNEGTIKVDNPKETNVYNEWQGNFRTGLLDLDLLKYAMECDQTFSKSAQKNLTITCIDQISEVAVTLQGRKHSVGDWESDFISYLPVEIQNLYLGTSPHSFDLRPYVRHSQIR